MPGELVQEEIQRHGHEVVGDTAQATDLIRSMALSSAELWHDVLQRLNELQESQRVLVKAVAELGAVVQTSQLESAAAPALAAPVSADLGGEVPVVVSDDLDESAAKTPWYKRRLEFRIRRRPPVSEPTEFHAPDPGAGEPTGEVPVFEFSIAAPSVDPPQLLLPPPPPQDAWESFAQSHEAEVVSEPLVSDWMIPEPFLSEPVISEQPEHVVSEWNPSEPIIFDPVVSEPAGSEPETPMPLAYEQLSPAAVPFVLDPPASAQQATPAVSAPAESPMELPTVPQPLVYTPSNAETSTFAPEPVVETAAVSESPNATQGEEAKFLRAARPSGDVLGLATEVLGTSLPPATVDDHVGLPTPLVISEDVTLLSKRRHRLQLRLR